MSNSTLMLLFFAAVGHAVWNALSSKIPNRDQFFSLIIFIAVITYLPLALYLLYRTHFPLAALKWLIGSIAFEIAYFICLANAYRVGSFLTVYPVARGSAPLITTVLSFMISGMFVGYFSMMGILMVVLGILWINQPNFSFGQMLTMFANPGTKWALLTGICTASYSVCDSLGASMMSPVLFAYSVFVGLCIGKLSIDRHQRQKYPYSALFKMYRFRAIIGGILIFGVNAAVVYTMQSTSVALVATVREMSIVFASLIGVAWLKERITVPKATSILLIIVGVLVIRG